MTRGESLPPCLLGAWLCQPCVRAAHLSGLLNTSICLTIASGLPSKCHQYVRHVFVCVHVCVYGISVKLYYLSPSLSLYIYIYVYIYIYCFSCLYLSCSNMNKALASPAPPAGCLKAHSPPRDSVPHPGHERAASVREDTRRHGEGRVGEKRKLTLPARAGA